MIVKVKGWQEIQQKLNRLTNELRAQVLVDAAMAGAEVIRHEASRRAPRRTGSLAEHIVAEVTGKGSHWVRVDIGPDRDHFYGRFIEFGHALVRVTGRVRRGRRTYRIKKVLGHVPPHPFLRPALDEGGRKAVEAVAEHLRAAIDRITRG